MARYKINILIIAFSLIGFGILSSSINAQSAGDVENPQSGSVGLEGAVQGDPPSRAATINTPVNGQVFSRLPITVSGSCEPGLIVEIYKNGVFSGSGECEDSGTYQIEIDLFIGQNELIARVRDLLGQTGPDSNRVSVTYEPPVERGERQLPSQQLLLTSTITFRGGPPGVELSFPVAITGGTGPYSVSVMWGDGNSDVLQRSDTGGFNLRHPYDTPGVYRIVIKATDESGSIAFLQLVAVVNGDGEGVSVSGGPTRVVTDYIIWPLYVILPLIPLAFWFGVRYQKRRYGL